MKQRDYMKRIFTPLSFFLVTGSALFAIGFLYDHDIDWSYPTEPPALMPNPGQSVLRNNSRAEAESQLLLHVCGMGEEDIDKALKEPHGTGVGQKRYYFGGRWMTFYKFMRTARRVGGEGVVCVVVHVERQMPCKYVEGGCVLHFYVRPKDTDVKVLQQLIEKVDFANLDAGANFETILDGGGNCGISAVLFATQYPKARIVSVEPGQTSYDILRMNTQRFSNVAVVRAGLWSREAKLLLYGPDHFAFGLQVTEAIETWKPANVIATVDGVSIPYLLRLSGLDHFDFIKIDIEGSEKELFSKTPENDLSFLENVKLAAIEVHEKMRRGSQKSVDEAFSSNFSRSSSGEYIIFTHHT